MAIHAQFFTGNTCACSAYHLTYIAVVIRERCFPFKPTEDPSVRVVTQTSKNNTLVPGGVWVSTLVLVGNTTRY